MPFDPIVFLNQNFYGLHLFGGLFYRWPVAIRFDLGGRAVTPEAMEVVQHRSVQLFESVFEQQDLCAIVAQDWPDEDHHVEFDYLEPLFAFAERHAIGIGVPDGEAELGAPDPEQLPSRLTWKALPSRSFGYRKVLEGIANADHARRPCIGGRVYFIHAVKRVIVHMYDDRGMDIIAADRENLRGLYRDFNEWILEYDRAAIARAFGI